MTFEARTFSEILKLYACLRPGLHKGRFSCTLRKQIRERERERERQTIVFLKSHVFSIREVTILHVRCVRADVIREHEMSPKRRRHLETAQFVDVDTPVMYCIKKPFARRHRSPCYAVHAEGVVLSEDSNTKNRDIHLLL